MTALLAERQSTARCAMKIGRLCRGVIVVAIAASSWLGAVATATPQLPLEILSVDPAGTWLVVDYTDTARAPTRLDLASNNISAGDKLILAERGSFIYNVGSSLPPGSSTTMMAVFIDASGNFLLPDPKQPVPFEVSLPSYSAGLQTDIPQDFHVASTGTAVMVPAGAVALLIGPDDSHFNDNVSQGYGVYMGCGAVLDSIIKEYDTYGVSLNPKCLDFTQDRHSVSFSFAELNTGDYAWALLRAPLVATAASGYGLDKLRQAYGGPRVINSAYRNPPHNASIGGATQSRHMYGDAADLRNASGTITEYTAMRSAAKRAHADYIEPRSGPCRTNCVHADWRAHAGAYHD